MLKIRKTSFSKLAYLGLCDIYWWLKIKSFSIYKSWKVLKKNSQLWALKKISSHPWRKRVSVMFLVAGGWTSWQRRGPRTILRQNFTTPPSIWFNWILFGLLYRDPMSILEEERTKNHPDQTQVRVDYSWSSRLDFKTQHFPNRVNPKCNGQVRANNKVIIKK